MKRFVELFQQCIKILNEGRNKLFVYFCHFLEVFFTPLTTDAEKSKALIERIKLFHHRQKEAKVLCIFKFVDIDREKKQRYQNTLEGELIKVPPVLYDLPEQRCVP